MDKEPILCGMHPERVLLLDDKKTNEGVLLDEKFGIWPLRKFTSSERFLRLWRFRISFGIDPWSSLRPRSIALLNGEVFV
jgi:hypothetical protein